jgi:hypothetical protein
MLVKCSIFFASLSLMVSCSHSKAFREVASKIPDSILAESVKEKHAFLGWKNNPREQTDFLNFEEVKSVSINCENSRIFPTHPQMDQKKYFNAKYGSFDHFKLSTESELCLLKTKSKNSKGNYTCLRADRLAYVVISDLYEDSCGNFYRGYKELLFQRSHENMGTLFSPGRSMLPDPKATVEGEYIYGSTYPVESAEFYFFTEVTDQERASIKVGKKQAEKLGIRWDPQTNTFQAYQ